MKTKLSVFCALLLTLCVLTAGALAATANASIVAPATYKLTAPFAGTLLPFDLTQGDTVEEGEILFALDTTPVYAVQNGTVAAVFVSEGDDGAGAQNHYGAMAYIEPEFPLYIDADNDDAYDKDENFYQHAGEELYLKWGNTTGTGMITRVDGDDYIVEIHSGDFDIDDTVRCFRESHHPQSSEIGRGKVKRYADIAVNASGRVAKVHVKPGDTVKTGDLLFEMIDAQSAIGVSPEISAPVSGAVTALSASSGAQVYRGQLLCEIADLSQLELSVELDELDLAAVHVGDTLSYTLDAYGEEVFSGTVTAIRPVGEKRQNATYFDVRVTAPQSVCVLPGMNGTVLLGE